MINEQIKKLNNELLSNFKYPYNNSNLRYVGISIYSKKKRNIKCRGKENTKDSYFFTIVTFFIIALSSLNFDKPDEKINIGITKVDKKVETTDKKTTPNKNEEKQQEEGENK